MHKKFIERLHIQDSDFFELEIANIWVIFGELFLVTSVAKYSSKKSCL